MESVRPRIASRVTPSLRSDQSGLDNMLDMIEFPHTDFPLQIAVCPSTGNFMVCSLECVKEWVLGGPKYFLYLQIFPMGFYARQGFYTQNFEKINLNNKSIDS